MQRNKTATLCNLQKWGLSHCCQCWLGPLWEIIRSKYVVAPQPFTYCLFPLFSLVSNKSVGVSQQSQRGTGGAGCGSGGAGLHPVPHSGAGCVHLPESALHPWQGEAAECGGTSLRVQPGELQEDAEGSHLRHDDLWLRLWYVGTAHLPCLLPSPRLPLLCHQHTEQMSLMEKAHVPPCL